ncbi:HSP20-like chaperone [Arabidopsis suecica]|uniref:HSP20-like chaperone n=1 Tax=Arabidopsis suecica TaxID=45249 RepID=A0A8T2AJV5_ARASU|nr:HSP20-like chaperone [Arabidopsis suecica]
MFLFSVTLENLEKIRFVPINSFTNPVCFPSEVEKSKFTKTSSKVSSSNEIKSNSLKMSMIPSFFNNNRRGNNIFDPFSLDVWDPFKELTSSSLSRENSAIVNARVDWRETPEAHVFKADLPGLKKEEVKVEIEEDSVLKISGERNVEKEDKNDTWHRVERSSGQFTRRFRLPENVKMDQVKAAMENGVLTVTVPKAETKKTDVKSIQITG